MAMILLELNIFQIDKKQINSLMAKKTDRRTNTDIYIKTDYTIQDIQTKRRTKRLTYLLTDIEKKRQTYIQTKRTDRHKDVQAERQTDRYTGSQTD